MWRTSLLGIVPPPLVAQAPPTVTSASAIASQALQLSLYHSVPQSAQNPVATRIKNAVLHPCKTWMAYMLDLSDTKNSSQRQIVVQDYVSGEIIFRLSMADLCALLFDIDRNSPTSSAKLSGGLRSLGAIHRVDFYDHGTLYANGMVYSDPNDRSSTSNFSHLVVQLSSRIILLNLRRGPNSLALDATLRQQSNSVLTNKHHSAYQPVVAQISESTLKALPSSTAVPLSPSLLLVGCTDGTVRVYDWKNEKMLKAGKAGKNDAIWHLISTNAYSQGHANSAQQVLKIVSISNKAVALLWEIVLSDGSLVDIRQPSVQMDGLFSAEPQARSPAGTSTTLTAITNVVGSDSSSFEHLLVDYDAHRELLMWFLPSGFKNSSRPHLLLWDLGSLTGPKTKKTTLSKHEPYVVSFPALDGASAMVSGWLHPSFPPQALVSAFITNAGEVSLQVINLETDCKPGRIAKAMPWVSSSLVSLVQKEVGAVAPPVIRPYFVTIHRRLDTGTLLVGCNLGVIRVGFVDEHVRARHAHLEKGILQVNHSMLQWGPLDVDVKNPHGRIPTEKHHQVIFQSPLAPNLAPEIQKRSIRMPPNLIPSPSRKYVCLFWPHESRYEILHVASSLRRSESFAPAVVADVNILDFCWVGDADCFALLHPPLESRSEPSTPTFESSNPLSSSMSVGSAAYKNFRKNFSIGQIGGRNRTDKSIASGVSTKSMDDTFKGLDRFMPRVELKILVGVTANATELGSVAAATARSLGEISLRGGTRHIPTTLFGGPSLCVASKAKESDGGAAYFYTLRPGNNVELSALNFITSGPTLPYPDFVHWDDEGILCAVVVQGLVSVYLSRDGEFSLLGNVQLGAPGEKGGTVVSLKFVHGVLFCSTKTTVQCVFLGDTLDEGICHLDSFVLSSAEGPVMLPQSSLAPQVALMTLNHPTILGYHSGSLLVSALTGVFAISLDNPLLRIGSLIAAGQHSRAQCWFAAIHPIDHESLVNFLDRRGCADLATHLSGVSLGTKVDLCLKYGLTSRLEELVQTYGVKGLRQVDVEKGVSVGIMAQAEHYHSLVVRVGAYLLSEGQLQLVQSMAAKCLDLGEGGKKEAFVLASLLLATADPTEPRKLLQASVGSKLQDDAAAGEVLANEYSVSALIRDHVL